MEWLNAESSYPLWAKAEELGAVFNIFLEPRQLSQVADMAARFPVRTLCLFPVTLSFLLDLWSWNSGRSARAEHV